MQQLSLDEFSEETWDYVSGEVVTDTIWENNQPLIRAITFDLYSTYLESVLKNAHGLHVSVMYPKLTASILEKFFRSLIEYKQIK